ncbi:aldehyde-activating protein [bacterium]|nr:aldehyde-activating protein [bacterium]
MTSACCCGAVSVTIAAKPDFIHDCNCSLCRKSGGAWGYFPSASVRTRGVTRSFARADRTTPGVEVHSCVVCSATTHWTLTARFKALNPTADQVGVNMRLFDPDELAGVEVRFPDGKAWSGTGPYGYRRPALTIGPASRW